MHALVWLFAIMLGGLGAPPVAWIPPGPGVTSGLWVRQHPAAPPASEVSAPGGSFGWLLGGGRPALVSAPGGSFGWLSDGGRLALVASVPAPAGSFRWPLDGAPRVVRRFDPPPEPWLAGHRGVDLAAEVGAPVRAAGAGTIHFAGRVAGRGVVSITHPSGLRTTYEPLEPTVRAGQAVAAGDQIGTLAAGHAGCPAAACLHWGLRRGEEYLDPLALLGLGRVRLLPLDASAPATWSAAGGGRPLPLATPAPATALAVRNAGSSRFSEPDAAHAVGCSAGVGR